ncbi:hypothetical protein GOP47_0008616 [Adiantum capillus-veneris]|uniref:Cation-transporting P-type ATPase C-terminal domain-containing protein n=1 Tax=Adiantum capillus-veneris TaxID=13818 RepID=A0A9D4UZ69_ADICA|nr:hypothetical protein GOP47_0008616 [Adiantum capillus-veneris]
MTVVSSWVCGKLRVSTEMDKEIKKIVEEKLFASICLNTNGHVGISEEGMLEVSGSPTEVACLNWATKLGAVFDDIQRENTIICVDTFNSTKKHMGVVIEEKNGSVWAHWKGASEVLLKQCTRYIDAEGNLFDLTKEKMEELEGIIVTFANSALRTLCFACRELPEHETQVLRVKKAQPDIPDQNLTCLAIVGIKDPLRPGVTDAVHKCQIAGIKVMARSSPTDKHTLVKRLLEMGDVVAATGDGTNDAPALHEASIGLAMGIAGTEVAKESADIIILDDNFASIVKVCNELNARKPEEANVFRGLMANRVFLYVIAFTVAVQVLLVEFCGSFTSTVHLTWHRWLLCVALGAVSMPLAAIIKCIPVPKQPIWSSCQHRDDLVFRGGGSVMSMMLRQGSQKVDLQRSRSVKSTKFYTEFSVDGDKDSGPESCCVKLKKMLCPLGVTPSSSNDVENQNMRNNNQAWQ